MTEASAVLDRFAPQLRWVVDHLKAKFGLLDHEVEDLRQEAQLQVLCYADVIPWPTTEGRHRGMLAEWETISRGKESEIKALLAYELRFDLTRIITKGFKQPLLANKTIDELVETDREPSEPSHEIESDNQMDEARYLRKYPTFARNILDGISQPELANQLGVSLPTVERRIRGEKRSFLTDTLRRANLVVEGDETMDELEEAYFYVTKTPR